MRRGKKQWHKEEEKKKNKEREKGKLNSDPGWIYLLSSIVSLSGPPASSSLLV